MIRELLQYWYIGRTMSSKCNTCGGKVKSIDVIINKCRCGYIYCSNHRINHNCNFDYKNDYKKHNALVKVDGIKVQKI